MKRSLWFTVMAMVGSSFACTSESPNDGAIGAAGGAGGETTSASSGGAAGANATAGAGGGCEPPMAPAAACLEQACVNGLGVGQSCTVDGGECNGLPAIRCTADFEDVDYPRFCTLGCSTDADCEDMAVCVFEPITVFDTDYPGRCFPEPCAP